MDCWGIAREFYKLAFNTELKSYYETIPNDNSKARDLISSNRGDFNLVTTPKFGDIMLIKLMGLECHIGVYLGDGLFLHTQHGTGCIIDRVTRWEKMISGYFRVKEEALDD